jgi:endoglucanase
VTFAYEATTTGMTAQPAFKVRVTNTNTGAGNVDLTQLTIQYYFTADGAAGLASQINSAQITTNTPPYFQAITTTTQVTFASFTPSTANADTVLTIAFASGVPALPPGGGVEVDVEYHAGSFAVTFNQANDYSYNGADTLAFSTSETLTVKIAGVTIWGVAP